VFELNPVRAWGAVLTSIVSMAASLYLIAISPWYLLPLAWALSGTAFTGVRSDLLPCHSQRIPAEQP
jgi:omega-6 fatty acid desaturase (delta-12 desaturase)